MQIPLNCGVCSSARKYNLPPFDRDPHTCCGLIWVLYEIDYRVDLDAIDKNCPLKNKKFREAIVEIRQSLFA